mgnify:CR=1 FL=1
MVLLEVAIKTTEEFIPLLVFVSHGCTKTIFHSKLQVIGKVVINTHSYALDTFFYFVTVATADVGIWCQHMIADISTKLMSIFSAHPWVAIIHKIYHVTTAVTVGTMLIALGICAPQENIASEAVIHRYSANIQRLAAIGGGGIAITAYRSG